MQLRLIMEMFLVLQAFWKKKTTGQIRIQILTEEKSEDHQSYSNLS